MVQQLAQPTWSQTTLQPNGTSSHEMKSQRALCRQVLRQQHVLNSSPLQMMGQYTPCSASS